MKKSSDNPEKSESCKNFWAEALCRLDGVGRFQTWGRIIKRGQGTVGSIIATPFWVFLNSIHLHAAIYLLILATITVVGVKAIRIYEKKVGGADLPEVIIDEFVGMGVSLFLLPVSWVSIIWAFVLFRIFDITKPIGVKFFDDRHLNGWGVMLDDVMAGLYAFLILQFIYLKGWL